MRQKKARRSVYEIAVAVLTVTAISAGLVQASGVNKVFAAEHIVEIKALKFVPSTLTVRIGDTITWINRDLAPHTATALDKSWDTGRLNQSVKKTLAVTRGMSLSYFCRFHPGMKAKLKLMVKE